MLLKQFEDTYLNNGWIGPWEEEYKGKNTLVIKKQHDKPKSNGTFWRTIRLSIYQCKYCKKNAIAPITNIPVCCSRYSECFSTHAGVQLAKNNVIHTRDNPGRDSDGYVCWRVAKLDKNGNKISTGNGYKRTYMYEHRVVMEEHLGRPLNEKYKKTKNRGDYEIVHHIDMVKHNNDLSNLWLCSVSQHTLAHASYNEICAELMINYNKYKGIKFNKKTGKYYLINKEINKHV